MEAYIQATRIANAIMMDQDFDGYYVIVEGVKDSKLFSKFVEKSRVKIKEAFGKEKVKDTVQILSERQFTNKIGIIDSDFNQILGVKERIEGLFITDHHDIEVMIIMTGALDNVCRTLSSSEEKLDRFEQVNKKSIRNALLEVGKEIGLLKLTNKIYNLGLVFKPQTADGNQIKYKDFIDEQTLQFIGTEQFIDTVLNYSRAKSENLASKEIIIEKLTEVSSKTYEIEHLVNGHDISNILYFFLKKTLGCKNKILQDFNTIEDCLILAYEYDDFKKTTLYSDIRRFEQSAGITLLRV